MKDTPLPTDKQYLYYLIISQLYSDGHMEAAMRLETSILETTGQVIPSNRLSTILSACLSSFTDVSFYINSRNNSAKSAAEQDFPSSLLNNVTRKRLHSGPPGLYPKSEAAITVAPTTAYSRDSPAAYSRDSPAAYAREGAAVSLLENGDVTKYSTAIPLTSVSPTFGVRNTDSTYSAQHDSTFSAQRDSTFSAQHEVTMTPRDVTMTTRDVSLTTSYSDTSYSAPQSTFVENKSEQVQSQLSKELEEICNAAVQDAAAEPEQNIKLEPDIKLEPVECSADNASLSGNISANISTSEDSTADEAAQNLLNNLSSITSISEISDITELTQSLVESLVQGNNVYSDVENNHGVYNVSAAAGVPDSPTKEPFVDSDKSDYTQGLPPLDYPSLSVYKQSNNLLNIMGYTSHSRHKPFRRHRTRFNDEQVAAMERYYTNISRYARPDNGLPELIRTTGLTHDTIMLWFQNKRARDKRKGWDENGGSCSGEKRAKMGAD